MQMLLAERSIQRTERTRRLQWIVYQQVVLSIFAIMSCTQHTQRSMLLLFNGNTNAKPLYTNAVLFQGSYERMVVSMCQDGQVIKGAKLKISSVFEQQKQFNKLGFLISYWRCRFESHSWHVLTFHLSENIQHTCLPFLRMQAFDATLLSLTSEN